MKTSMISLKGLALLLTVCFFGSCAKSILYWQQAQESFDRGAKLEVKNHYAERLQVQGEIPAEALPNINSLVSTPVSNIDAGATPQQYYRQADEKVTAALGTPGPLVKEDKLGNAMTLKALTCWKTGQADEARANADSALGEFDDPGDDNPRDKPLAQAVPGLVALDLAYDSTKMFIERLKELSGNAPNAPRSENETLVAEGTRLFQKFISDPESRHSISHARITLQEARALANENADLRRFFLLCELTGLKNRFDFWAQLNNFAKRSGLKAEDAELAGWLDQEEMEYLEEKDAALDRLKGMLEGNENHSVYRFWEGIL